MSSVLQGGRRRRRRGSLLAVLLALLAAPATVAAALYVALEEDGRDGPRPTGASAAPLGAGAPPARRAPGLSREPSPLVEEQPVPDVPLNSVDAFYLRMRTPPAAALLFDVGSGEVLWRHRPLTRLPVASLTKIMTAIVVTERTRPRAPVRITRAALRYQGSGVGVLPRGKRVRLETLLNGLMLVSGNDAAIALAVHVAGSERRFVGMMNERARRLGLHCTRFADSHGLSAANVSCARDLAVLTRLAMSTRRIARIARRRHVSFRFPIKGGRVYFSGHNPLIRAGYRGAVGLKTGYTLAAGRCFVGVARRGSRTLGVVLLDSPNTLRQSARLLNLGFANP
jgi:serine-type D-Ala-D-Ala carboxypeptidase (penicillin-binding protein 5/6)